MDEAAQRTVLDGQVRNIAPDVDLRAPWTCGESTNSLVLRTGRYLPAAAVLGFEEDPCAAERETFKKAQEDLRIVGIGAVANFGAFIYTGFTPLGFFTAMGCAGSMYAYSVYEERFSQAYDALMACSRRHNQQPCLGLFEVGSSTAAACSDPAGSGGGSGGSGTGTAWCIVITYYEAWDGINWYVVGQQVICRGGITCRESPHRKMRHGRARCSSGSYC